MEYQELKLGEKLRLARKKCGMTQEDLAMRLSVSRQAVTRWETDAGTPDVQILPAIARTLNLSLDYLFGLVPSNDFAEKLSTTQPPDCYDPNQGARILRSEITPYDAKRFYGAFWGRTDVYSRRIVNRQTGKVGYYTQCDNFWKDGCPRKRKEKLSCHKCNWQSYRELKLEDIEAHLRGTLVNGQEMVIGVYPLEKDDSCRFLVYDFDNHGKNAEESDFANTDEEWREEVGAMREICRANGIDALVERSRSGRGAHVWILFKESINAALARKFGNALLQRGAELVNLKSFRYYDRMLPMQDHLPEGGLGNLIALPLQGQALLEGNSAFVDENWNAYPDQLGFLFQREKYGRDFLEDKIREWGLRLPFDAEPAIVGAAGKGGNEAKRGGVVKSHDMTGTGAAIADNSEPEKPWKKEVRFNRLDVDGKMRITLVDGVYVETANLAPRIQNRIREMAAFSNPVFYKNQAMGLSNFDQARFIYLGRDEGGYIHVPGGLRERIVDACEKENIAYQIDDERCEGKEICVAFSGLLREQQTLAAEALLSQENGILQAATAFGKTVVCCYLIAQRKRSTLILLQSSALMEQWVNSLEKFLDIEEEPPEYETPSGQIRRRKRVIGRLQGAHDSTTGIIDIAMVGSVCKKGTFHRRLKEYGLVLLDECHHAASDTIVEILQAVNAKYVYGVTATPQRSDGLEKMNEMLLGPIRYKYTSRDLAKSQRIEHLVYPRFTRAVAPRFQTEKMHPNEAYAIVRDNEDRDQLIIRDVKACVQEGRTPVILSKFVDHARRLYEALKTSADRVFLLVGEDSKREQRQILEEMSQVLPQETMILVATGKLIGEGFDFPRLDTLIMATPVAWKGVVAQYAGRLNREYEGKTNVMIYDYVDRHIPMFEKMYYKRLKAYRQIGYEISQPDLSRGQEKINSIFGIDNYYEVYKSDLLVANREIILASPAISRGKIEEFTALLREKQESGLRVVIVTWKPERYGYGDSAYWLELQETMRQSGFEMNLVDDYCERYCIVDRELVWYGSLNFLGKEDADDNLMRVKSREVAAELMEMTFGGKGLAD